MATADKMALVFRRKMRGDKANSLALVPYDELTDEHLFDGRVMLAIDPRVRAMSFDERVQTVLATAFYLVYFEHADPCEVHHVLDPLEEFQYGMQKAHDIANRFTTLRGAVEEKVWAIGQR